MGEFFFDLETTGLLEDRDAVVTTYGCLSSEGLLCSSSVDRFVEQFMREKEKDPDLKVVSFNGKNFDVPFLKRLFPNPLHAPPLLHYFTDFADSKDKHVDLMPFCAKVFNEAARDLSIKEIEDRMDKDSKVRIHKDDACKYFGIYVPKNLPAKSCAIIGKRYLKDEGNVVIRGRYEHVLQHCALDLIATASLYRVLFGEGWV